MSQQNKTTLQSAINTQIADNTSGAITAANVRNNFINLTDSLVFNTGSQAITGSLTVTGGITGSLFGTAATASYLSTGPYTETFGGALQFTAGSDIYAFGGMPTSTRVINKPIFTTSLKNCWVEASIFTNGSYGIGHNITLQFYASANGNSRDVLLGTYNIPTSAGSTLYKIQRSFWMSSGFDGETGETYYNVAGYNTTTSSISDPLTPAPVVFSNIGINTIAYPYLALSVSASVANNYSFIYGPGRITYG
jgi:hypothetical protein